MTKSCSIYVRGLLFVVALFFSVRPAESHLAQFTSSIGTNPCREPMGGGATPSPCKDHWDFTIHPMLQWQLNPSVSGFRLTGTRSVADVVQAAFDTWTDPTKVPNINLTKNVNISRGPDTSVTQTDVSGADGINLVCFVCGTDFTRDSGALAVTVTTVANRVGQLDPRGGVSVFGGQILDADIVFNPDPKNQDGNPLTWNSDGPADSNQLDLQTVATHEVGHFFGLDHSGVVRAIMFPFAPPQQRLLSMDDVAAMAALYPKAANDVLTGAISGTVTFAGNNAPIFGAHVFAESTSTTNDFTSRFPLIRKTPIGTLTLPDGSYKITGLPGDSYIVTAEPLDGPATNDDVRGYPAAFGQPSVQTGFTTRTH